MNYIKGLDGLRFLFVLSVVLTHLGFYVTWEVSDSMQRLIGGNTGVNCFFALSGFLITRILLYELKENGRINIIRFFKKRILRLSPPLICFFTLVYLLHTLGYVSESKQYFLFSLFYIANYIPKEVSGYFFGHMWSLSVEEQFYFIWPFIMSLKKKIIILIISAIFIVLCLNSYDIYDYFNININEFHIYRFSFPAFLSIIIGSIFSILHELGCFKRIDKYIFLSLAILIFMIPYYSEFHVSLFFHRNYLTFIAIGISIFIILIIENQDSYLVKAIDNPLFSYLGKISYGIYVYHGLFLLTGPSGVLPINKYPQNIVLTLILSIISYEVLEKNILKLKNRL